MDEQDAPPPSVGQGQIAKQGERRKKKAEGQSNTAGASKSDGSPVQSSPAVTKKNRSRRRHASTAADGTQHSSHGPNDSPQPSPIGKSKANTTPATPAYAGPTFHASPAPSELPIPKFFLKSLSSPNVIESVPSQSALGPPQINKSDPNLTTETNPSVSTGSPLDIFFKADREEKAKRNSGPHLSNNLTQDGRADLSFEQRSISSRSQNISRPNGNFDKSNFHTSGRDMFSADMPRPKGFSGNNQFPVMPVFSRSNEAKMPIHNDQHQVLPNDQIYSPIPQRNGLQDQNTPGSRPPSEPVSFHGNGSPVTRRDFASRSSSGPSTPVGYDNEQEMGLHYGNKNLSPLFRATRTDPTKRTSGLRQEFTYTQFSVQNPNSPITPVAMLNSRQRPVGSMDSSEFSHQRLHSDKEIAGLPNDHSPAHTSSFAEPSNLNIPKDPDNTGSANSRAFTTLTRAASEPTVDGSCLPLYTAPLTPALRTQHSNQADVASKGASFAQSADVKSPELKALEDDLRRMLKLTVMESMTKDK